jgi:hypothetical protein
MEQRSRSGTGLALNTKKRLTLLTGESGCTQPALAKLSQRSYTKTYPDIIKTPKSFWLRVNGTNGTQTQHVLSAPAILVYLFLIERWTHWLRYFMMVRLCHALISILGSDLNLHTG